MEIFILRHGEAEPRGNGVPETDRALTPKGKRDLRSVLAVARRAKAAPHVILTSPLRRAQQTAAAAAKVFGVPVIETPHLLPMASPDLLWKQLGTMKDAEAVLVAGHEPHLSNFVRFLLESAVAMDLKKGALVRVSTRNRIGPPRGVLKWILTPKLARSR